jgi:hypothetical protein
MQGKFEDLLNYCLMDAKLVYQLFQLSTVKCHGRSSMKLDICSGKWCTLSQSVVSRKADMKIHSSEMRQALPQDNLWNPETVYWVDHD